jgi:hypothetical protein
MIMAEANFFYLEPQPSAESPIGGQPTSTTPSSSVQQTSNVTTRNDGSNLASRVESLENLTSDIRENWAKKGQNADFANLDVKDRLTANFGKIGGFDVSSGVLSTNKLIIDSNNENIRSTNYTPGVSGFKVSGELVEAENLFARGALRGVSFNVNDVSVVGGELMVANGGNLEVDMTADDNSKLILKSGNSFAVSDLLLIQQATASGITSEWLTVTAKSGNTYTVTRDLAGSFTANNNPKWSAGTPVVKQGDTSSPNFGGWLRLIGEGTNAPYYSVFQRNSATYNDYTEVCRLGNLNGFLGYSSDLYGIAIGDATGYLKYDTSNGFRLLGSVEAVSLLEAGIALTEGQAVVIYSDGKVYSSDSLVSTMTSSFIGFCTANTALGSLAPIVITGQSTHQAGLTTASNYYLNDATHTIDQSDTVINGSAFAIGTSETRYQSFTTGSSVNHISSIKVEMSGAATEDITLRIRTGSGVGGTLLLTMTQSVNPISTPEVTFYLPYPLAVSPSTQYSMTFVSSGNSVNIREDSTASYTGGTNDRGADYMFKTLYTTNRGVIGTSAGTNGKKVGLALASTKLLILNS